MIGKLSGRIDYRAEDHILLDVKGIGYLVYCSERTMMSLPGPGEAVALYTDLLVREDLLQLFGFSSLVEKEWHRLLMSVQGVGAKASLAILGALGADGVRRAIALGDWNAVKAAKGIGPKTAQRVVIELKDKAPSVMAMAAQNSAPASVSPPLTHEAEVIEASVTAPAAAGQAKRPEPSAEADALAAWTRLGYAPGGAASAVMQAVGTLPEGDSAAIIRAALQLLAPKG